MNLCNTQGDGGCHIFIVVVSKIFLQSKCCKIYKPQIYKGGFIETREP